MKRRLRLGLILLGLLTFSGLCGLAALRIPVSEGMWQQTLGIEATVETGIWDFRPIIRLEPGDKEPEDSCGDMFASALIVHNDGARAEDKAEGLQINIVPVENAEYVERIEFNVDAVHSESGYTWQIDELPAGESATLGFIVFVQPDTDGDLPIRLAFEVTNEANWPERNVGLQEVITVAHGQCDGGETLEDATDEPIEVLSETLEPLDTPEPQKTAEPTEEATDTPEPTEEMSNTPEPTDGPTQTLEASEDITNTPEPTEETKVEPTSNSDEPGAPADEN